MKKEPFNKKLLEILICPVTREKLFYDEKNNRLVNHSKTYCYPITQNIPVLLVDKATKL